MQRIRLLRIVLPIVLLGLAATIVLTLRSRPDPADFPQEPPSDPGARMEGFRFSDLVGGRRRLLLQAHVGRVDDKGAFDVEQVERLEVDRVGQTPLVMTATRGAGTGAQGKRKIRLEGGVTVHDEGAGLALEIPTVEVDQVAGVVRSLGPVRLTSKAWTGTASAVIYSLVGEPSQVATLELNGPDGGRLVAQRATIPEGAKTLTLSGGVEAGQSGMAMHAEEIAVLRGEDGRLESATAKPAVTGSMASLGGGAASFAANAVRVRWDRNGRIDFVGLSGGARIRHARGALDADVIEGRAVDAAGALAVEATGQVVATGTLQKGPGTLSCGALHTTIDGSGTLRDGTATGNVRFDGDGAAGEAAEASFTALGSSGTVTLHASDTRRARLANGRMRLVADTIVSDFRGEKTHAEGRVESTMLPIVGADWAGGSPMFRSSEAVHFVSASLDSDNGGGRLLLRGDARGWQGERTLSADQIEMLRAGEILNATGHVATRMPRDASKAAIEADYVQIGSERLTYRGTEHTAQYDGDVRVRQAEGWLQTPQLVATLAAGGPGLSKVQALHGVRFEYRSPGERGVPTTAAGEGDRAVYDAVHRVLRVFGDTGPATVRNTGTNGGTTVGRVLRYDLDSGAIEVESGERDRATIRTK